MTEIGIEQARKSLGDIANRADLAGTITYLTRNGRQVAAIVPLERIMPLTLEQQLAAVETEMAALPHLSDRCTAEEQAAIERADLELIDHATDLHQAIADVHAAHRDTDPCENCD